LHIIRDIAFSSKRGINLVEPMLSLSSSVGLAVSDPSGVLAAPLETLRRDESDTRADQARIAVLARETRALEVVVGLPRSLSGREGEAARLARVYAGQLAALLAPTPVRLVDERLTTVESHRKLREGGVSGRAQRSVVDQAAAVLILQTALDTESSSGQLPGELVSEPVPGPRREGRR